MLEFRCPAGIYRRTPQTGFQKQQRGGSHSSRRLGWRAEGFPPPPPFAACACSLVCGTHTPYFLSTLTGVLAHTDAEAQHGAGIPTGNASVTEARQIVQTMHRQLAYLHNVKGVDNECGHQRGTRGGCEALP